MVQHHGYFQYPHLKLLIVLLRVWVRFSSADKIRRDKALAPPDVEHERIKIPSREPGRYILADLYYPPGFRASSPLFPRPPILVN
ncbi:hypothetical protein EKO27_g7797 [Xylaria grammica]|uniref:Uncharacterized protein n=1 Tax=Xylaria grammica TaxID=363999 RepID=A0A439CYU3_9PEZI|nr:hypothetical protein EKO27_g7797 [Xylaria grammica]